MIDLPTKILLVVVAMGVWLNALLLVVGNEKLRAIEAGVRDNWRLADIEKEIKHIARDANFGAISLRSIEDQLARPRKAEGR